MPGASFIAEQWRADSFKQVFQTGSFKQGLSGGFFQAGIAKRLGAGLQSRSSAGSTPPTCFVVSDINSIRVSASEGLRPQPFLTSLASPFGIRLS